MWSPISSCLCDFRIHSLDSALSMSFILVDKSSIVVHGSKGNRDSRRLTTHDSFIIQRNEKFSSIEFDGVIVFSTENTFTAYNVRLSVSLCAISQLAVKLDAERDLLRWSWRLWLLLWIIDALQSLLVFIILDLILYSKY